MAKEIRYEPEAQTKLQPQEEFDALIETLSESGALRAMRGLAGRFPHVVEVLLDEANSPAGKNLVGVLAALGEGVVKIPPDRVRTVVKGMENGVEEADRLSRDDPPNLFQLLKLANDPDVRRAMGMGLTVLKAVGAEMSDTKSDKSEKE